MNKMLLLAYIYLIGLFVWLLLHRFVGDGWWLFFLLNNLALYLFVPLFAVGVIAFLTHSKALWIGCGAGFLVAALMYGELFLPRLSPAVQGNVLTVMTFNVMNANEQGEHVVAAIQEANADVIFLQELNQQVAERIWLDLRAVYPYQAFDIQSAPGGMGTISRYPLRPVAANLPGKWMGTPQVFQMTFATQLVTLVNIHAINISGESNLLPTPARITCAVRQREAQAQVLHTFAATHPFPLIVAGDFNTGDKSRAYAILTERLVDSWRTCGWGFGHTFPGFIYTGDVFPYGDHVPFPFWMIRIDYIFHSSDWRVVSVQTGPWNGSSDHRPVVAQLILYSGNHFYHR